VIVFITSIRHPENCSSYLRVVELLQATLGSVFRQSDDGFRVVVVHNGLPESVKLDPRVSLVKVDFPAPSQERTARIDFDSHRRDKGTKLVVGVAKARELGADHVMFIDADDLMHRHLVALANAEPDHPGWYSPSGVIHSVGSRRVHIIDHGFENMNGSTGIIRLDLTSVPTNLSTLSSQDEILGSMSSEFVNGVIGSHGKWQGFLADKGFAMEPIPFPVAIWEIGTGENQSGKFSTARASKLIDSGITRDFGLELPSRFEHVRTTASLTVRRLRDKIRRGWQ
jgi:hypothetical protein